MDISKVHKKKILLGGLISLTALTLGVTILGKGDLPNLFATGTGNSEYSLTLNSSNKQTSDTDDVTITTDNGVGYVHFKYSGVKSSTSGHATLNANGYINNITYIRSISSIKAKPGFSGL